MSAAPIAIVETSKAIDESRIKQLWATVQAVDQERTKHGLEFGKAMFEYRKPKVERARSLVLDLVTVVCIWRAY